MKIIDFYASDDQNHCLSEINKSDWRAGKYLYELLRNQKLKELCGESTKALLLVDVLSEADVNGWTKLVAERKLP